MKNIALVVLLVAALGFAGLYIKEAGKHVEARAAAENLQRRIKEMETAAAEQETKSAALQTELKQSWEEGTAKDRQIAQLKAASANPALAARAADSPERAKQANPLSALAKVFDDPAMKEAIAAQQKAALAPMLEKNYGALFAQLGLNADESAALKELLLKKHMAGAEMGMSMFAEEGAKPADLAQKVKAATEATDAEIRAFLGDERFAQMQSYERTLPDRMAISGFKDQLGANAGLSAEQEQRLIAAMTQERQNFRFSANLSDPAQLGANPAAMFNEETVNRFMEETDQLNQRFLGQAQGILTAEQLEAFQRHLQQQQTMQRLGMQMGARLFGGGTNQ